MPIYWAFLTYILLKPITIKSEDLWVSFEGMDKIVHFLAFGVLGFFYLSAFPRQRLIVFIGVMLSYALLTEVLQEIIDWGRSMELMDFLADAGGIMLAYFIWKKVFCLKG